MFSVRGVDSVAVADAEWSVVSIKSLVWWFTRVACASLDAVKFVVHRQSVTRGEVGTLISYVRLSPSHQTSPV